MTKVDLSDLLSSDGKPVKGAKIIILDDLLRVPRRSRVAQEVVLFWTDWNCNCGRRYEMPTYGDTLTRYDQYYYDKVVGSIYQKYLPANHADLPRRLEANHICISHCPSCLAETQLIQDHQGDLFNESA
ncbi:hypothetical protein LCGC14_2300460 [marine sediment metagenome]|uniref:Uncharacterized protein n=1 Tax=marine sediment metagenome TaxID=412755 RepID=A0A0F9FIK4_9ZZZZ